MTPSIDTAFTGSVAQFYERYMVPLIFEPYAIDLARRVAHAAPRRVLELAAGTGVVTRQLAAMLDASIELVATDLNPAMLDEAARIGTARPVEWRQADAMQMPFDETSFDAVVCQFGVMFFPDKPGVFAQPRRVLRPGGLFAFNVWGPIAANEFANPVTDALAEVFPQDPPRFLVRTPHGYHDATRIAQDLATAGFTSTPMIESMRSPAVRRWRASWRLPTATVPRCAAKSKRVTRTRWAALPAPPKRSWRAASATDRSKGASKRSS